MVSRNSTPLNPWEQRSRRARFLAEGFPAAREILTFYAGLAEWQGHVAPQLTSFSQVTRVMPSLLSYVTSAAPPVLAQSAREFDMHLAETILRDYWQTRQTEPLTDFFARAALQPYASRLPEGFDCPGCRQPPQAGCLRKQGDGQAFELVCFLCLRRRPFARTTCPGCNTSADSAIVHYTATAFPHLRLLACENCKGSLIVVDLEKDPAAIPEVDELAALPLHLWAVEHGYHKLQPNFAGV